MGHHSVRRILFMLAAGAALLHPGVGTARQTVVNGSIGVGFDYWERTYDNENAAFLLFNPDEGDKRDWGLRPEIELTSQGEHDSLLMRYAPVLFYDDLLDTSDINHYLTLNAERNFTKNWKASLSEDYVQTDDPRRYGATFDSGGAPAEEITQDVGRTRYWTNNLILQTGYVYGEESDVGLGYGYRVLRNESDENSEARYDEYDRHDLFGSWSSRLNPSWRTKAAANYIQGLFDDREVLVAPGVRQLVSQDLEEYHGDLGVAYARSDNDAFPLAYRYRGTDYEGMRRDIAAQEVALGWDHAFDAHTRLEVVAGPAYVDAEDLEGEWDVAARAHLTRSFQHGELSLLVDKRYEPRNFTGGDDGGMVDLTEAGIDLTYQFSPTLSSTLFGLYRNEDILDPQGEYLLAALGGQNPLSVEQVGDVSYERDSFSAGASIDYSFWRWFVASLRYIYYQQDGELDSDSFTDHRVMVLVSAGKELWRW